MQKSGGISGFVIFGAIFALMFQFKLFRLFMIALGLWLAVQWVKDWQSDYTVTGLDPSYSITIDNIQRDNGQFNPAFTMDVQVRNNSQDFMEKMTVDAILYECPNEYATMTECQALATTPVFVTLHRGPGFLFRDNINVSFDTQELPQSAHTLVQMNVREVTFDKDRNTF